MFFDINLYLLTLTQIQVEQLLQKEEKRIRSSLYRVIAKYNGRWFPLFSQGCQVCIAFPISDEPRISINTGDNITVTRWKKHWLYGEKFKTDNALQGRERGWFPRKCVVKVITATNTPNNTNIHNIDNTFVINNKVSKKLN